MKNNNLVYESIRTDILTLGKFEKAMYELLFNQNSGEWIHIKVFLEELDLIDFITDIPQDFFVTWLEQPYFEEDSPNEVLILFYSEKLFQIDVAIYNKKRLEDEYKNT